MNITIESNQLKAEISTNGAEIQHLVKKSDGTELIWNGDVSVWKNHAPILFPYVGRCLNGYYTMDGKKCENTTNHGFVRGSETTVIAQEKDKVTFELTPNDAIAARYPYKFALQVSYEITDKDLNWKMTVINKDDKPIKFAIGTHTAFACPRNTDPAGTEISDYQIEFQKKEDIKSVVMNDKGFVIPDGDGNYQVRPSLDQKGIVPVTKEGFGTGLCVTGFDSEWIGLRNKKDNSLIKISTKGFPHAMLWQNDKGDPQFVCIEPWYGLPDTAENDGNWETKLGLNTIQPGEKFESVQNISYEE